MTEAKVATTTLQTTHHIPLPPEGGRDQLITDCSSMPIRLLVSSNSLHSTKFPPLSAAV